MRQLRRLFRSHLLKSRTYGRSMFETERRLSWFQGAAQGIESGWPPQQLLHRTRRSPVPYMQCANNRAKTSMRCPEQDCVQNLISDPIPLT